MMTEDLPTSTKQSLNAEISECQNGVSEIRAILYGGDESEKGESPSKDVIDAMSKDVIDAMSDKMRRTNQRLHQIVATLKAIG